MNKLFKLTAGAALTAVVLYGAAGYFVVPGIVKSALSEQIENQFRLTPTIENVSFNPWNLTLEITGVRVDGSDAGNPILSLNRFFADLSSSTITKAAPVIDKLTVDGLHVNADLNDPLLASIADGENDEKTGRVQSAEKNKGASGFPAFAVYDISVNDSFVRVIDRKKGIDEALTDINIVLPFISTLPNTKNAVVTPSFSFRYNGTPVVATGTTDTADSGFETSLHTKLDNLDISPFVKLFPAIRDAGISLQSAKLSTDLTFTFRNPSDSAAGKTILSGTVSLSDVRSSRTHQKETKDLLRASRVSVSIDELDLIDRNASINEVSIEKPNLNLINYAPSRSAQAGSGSSGGKSASGDGWSWSLKKAVVKNGSVSITDKTSKPELSVRASALNTEIRNLSSDKNAKPATVRLNTNILQGTLAVEGTVDIHSSSADLKTNAEHLQIGQVAPLIRKTTGYDMAGAISFNMNGSISSEDVLFRGRVSATNAKITQHSKTLLNSGNMSLDIENFDLGNKTVTVNSVNVSNTQVSLEKTGKDTASASKSDSPKSKAKDDDQWQWSMAQINLKNCRINIKDQTASPGFSTKIDKINAKISHLSSLPGKTADLNGSAVFSGGRMNSKGTLTLSPLALNLTTDISALSMKELSPVMQTYTGMGAKSGTLDTRGKITLENDIVSWVGNVNLLDFDIRDAKGSSLMFWKNASLDGLTVKTTDPLYFVVDKAVIMEPGTKHTKAVQQIAGIAGILAGLSGDEKAIEKIGKVDKELNRTIVLENVRWVNGRFSANGINAQSVAGMLLQKLTDNTKTRQKKASR